MNKVTNDVYYNISVVDRETHLAIPFHIDDAGMIVVEVDSNDPLVVVSETKIAVLSVELYNALPKDETSE